MDIPSTVYVAAGAVTAGLIAGFFSFVNLVSAKENKVSEFRLDWINGLRDEVADYIACAQSLALVWECIEADAPATEPARSQHELAHYEKYRDALSGTIRALSKIQLRLNPHHVKSSGSPEARLLKAVQTVRCSLNNRDYGKLADGQADVIREETAQLLKSTWDLVKHGERGYQTIRRKAQATIAVGIALTLLVWSALAFLSLLHGVTKPTDETAASRATVSQRVTCCNTIIDTARVAPSSNASKPHP